MESGLCILPLPVVPCGWSSVRTPCLRSAVSLYIFFAFYTYFIYLFFALLQFIAFINQKSRSLYTQKIKAQRLVWTQQWRARHKKGRVENIQKRKVKRSGKVYRAIQGLSVDDLKKRRNQKSDIRKAARESVIRYVLLCFVLMYSLNVAEGGGSLYFSFSPFSFFCRRFTYLYSSFFLLSIFSEAKEKKRKEKKKPAAKGSSAPKNTFTKVPKQRRAIARR